MVAPEDLRCGDFVAVLNELAEFPSLYWCDAAAVDPSEPVRIRFMDSDRQGPMKVKAICLPFLFVKSPTCGFQTLDVRQHDIVRVAKPYGTMVWKKLKRQLKQQRKRLRGR